MHKSKHNIESNRTGLAQIVQNGVLLATHKHITLFRPRLTFIQGQRDHKLLVVGGYTYARNNFSKNNTIYWACRTSYDRVRCNSRVVTTLLSDGTYRIVITNPRHNHPRRVSLSKEYMLGLAGVRPKTGLEITPRSSSSQEYILGMGGVPPKTEWEDNPRSSNATRRDPRRQRTKKNDQTKWLKIDLSPILQKPSEPVVLVPCRLGGMKVSYHGFDFEYHTAKSGIKHYRCVQHAQYDSPTENKNRKADYRHNQLEFELPDPVKPGVSCIRSYRPVKKINDPDGKQRKRATAVTKATTADAGRLRKLPLNEILATPGTPVVYLTNRFGSAKVVLDEHHYVYHFAANGVSYYRCEQFKRNQCPARILVVEIQRILANTFASPKHKLINSPNHNLSHASISQAVPKRNSTKSNAATSHSSPPSNQCPSTAPGGREMKQTKHMLNFSQITNGTPVPMTLLPTRKGAAGVLCQGHHFQFRYSRHHHKVYRCAWHSSHACQAQVLLHDRQFYIVDDKHTHTALPDTDSDDRPER
uniref:FLYWCH-type domain-containing protein n=1 Tax=Anopheles culicifacies TaxID=139723 RepID=A0A182M5E9_9DIPT